MNWIYLIESDHASYTEVKKQQNREQIAKVRHIVLLDFFNENHFLV